MSKKLFYRVITKFFDNGRVDVAMCSIEAFNKPKNRYEQHSTFDIYYDYFVTKEEACVWVKQAKEA